MMLTKRLPPIIIIIITQQKDRRPKKTKIYLPCQNVIMFILGMIILFFQATVMNCNKQKLLANDLYQNV